MSNSMDQNDKHLFHARQGEYTPCPLDLFISRLIIRFFSCPGLKTPVKQRGAGVGTVRSLSIGTATGTFALRVA